ncbi:MAG: sensor histidine kinase, partial [Aquincola sp.]|nr:sensor histidine kinase [Aquincola sp.]
MARSLRRRLLAGVMLPLLGAVAVDGWISWRDAQATAGLMQDRLLLGAARIVAEQLHWQDGALPSQVPPAALELFEAGEADRVYYRVSTAAGHIVTGYAELVPPAVPLQPELPHFFSAAVRGQPVRAVAYLQPVPGERGVEPVTVAIAQTMNGHAALVRSLWARSMGQQALLLALVAALVLLGLRRVLRPLLALRDAVLSREAGSLQPLAVPAMPHELQPLVAAINDYARRLDQYAGAQRSFIQNAAHQLRTPLTVLTTQVNYALRADGAQRQESLEAIRGTVAHSGRLVNQMLMLSAAEAQAEAGEVDAAT